MHPSSNLHHRHYIQDISLEIFFTVTPPYYNITTTDAANWLGFNTARRLTIGTIEFLTKMVIVTGCSNQVSDLSISLR